MGDTVYQLAVEVRGPIQGQRLGELCPPAVLAPKGPAPSGPQPDDRVGLAGHPKVAARQVPGKVPRLLQGVQPAGAVALGGGTARVTGAPALRVQRLASQLASELSGAQT